MNSKFLWPRWCWVLCVILVILLIVCVVTCEEDPPPPTIARRVQFLTPRTPVPKIWLTQVLPGPNGPIPMPVPMMQPDPEEPTIKRAEVDPAAESVEIVIDLNNDGEANPEAGDFATSHPLTETFVDYTIVLAAGGEGEKDAVDEWLGVSPTGDDSWTFQRFRFP